MAAVPMIISEQEFRGIFGDSDSEDSSDIEFNGLDTSDSDSGEEDEEDEQNEQGEEEEDWSEDLSEVVVEEFNSPVGKTFPINPNASQLDVFTVLFDEELLERIVEETNRYARQKLASNQQRLAKWKDTTSAEMKAYFGVCIIMGINNLPCIADYWSSDLFLGNDGIKKVMTKNRFEELNRYLHFNDSSLEPGREDAMFDRLYKIRPLLDCFNNKMREVYNPSKNLSVDEGMISFKGRLSFRQYMPAKPTKYGIKIWLLADSSNGFVLNHKVYLGKERGQRTEHGLGYNVVTSLTRPYFQKYHHVYFDNFFSSPKLLDDLEKGKTFACSTVRPNRKGLPPAAQRKLKKKGENIVIQKGNLVFLKWHDKRDVNVLFNNSSPLEAPVITEKRTRNGETTRVEKPNAVVLYNKNMGGVDRADQLRSYYSVGRSSHKWYKYIFWFIFEVLLGNAYILDKQYLQRQARYTIQDFRLAIGKQLIGGFSSRSDNRKRSMKAAAISSSVSPENVPGHFIARREGNARKRHCVQCKKDGRKTASDRARETIYECQQCGVALCKEPCFLRFHSI